MMNWVRAKTRSIRKYYQENGFWKSVNYSFSRVGDYLSFPLNYVGLNFYRKDLIFFERRLGSTEFGSLVEGEWSDCIEIDKEGMEKVENYFDGWFNKERALNRLEEGRILFGTVVRGQLITCFWVEVGNVIVPSLDLEFRIPTDAACIAYIFTAREERGKGIARKALPFVLRGLRRKGYRHAFLLIAPQNEASQKLNKGGGFVDYQRVTYKKVSFRGLPLLKYYRVKDVCSKKKKLFMGGSERGQSELWCRFSGIQGRGDKELFDHGIPQSSRVALPGKIEGQPKLARSSLRQV